MAENPVGDFQGVGGGVKFPRGTDTPRVEELPQGGKTSRVTSEGDRVPRVDGRGREGDGNSPATQDTEGSGNNSCGEEMESGQEPAAPQSPQWGTTEGRRGEVRPHRHPDSADGPRTEHGALAQREHGLLAPEEPTGNPAAVEPQGGGDSPEDTSERRHTYERETRAG